MNKYLRFNTAAGSRLVSQDNILTFIPVSETQLKIYLHGGQRHILLTGTNFVTNNLIDRIHQIIADCTNTGYTSSVHTVVPPVGITFADISVSDGADQHCCDDDNGDDD